MVPKLLIVLESTEGKAVPLATVRNPDILHAAAAEAVRELKSQAVSLGVRDHSMGIVAAEDACRLERTLAQLLPTFNARPVSALM